MNNMLSINLIRNISILLIISMGITAIVVIPDLPDIIPTHYGWNGYPDDDGSKNYLYIFPAVGLVLFLIMEWARRNPKYISLPSGYRGTNRTKRLASANLNVSRIIAIVILFLHYVMVKTIFITKETTDRIHPFWTILFIVSILTIVILDMRSEKESG